MGGSPRGQIGGTDWNKIGKSLLIGLGGFALAFITGTVLPALEGGTPNVTTMAITAACTVVANAIRLALSNTQ